MVWPGFAGLGQSLHLPVSLAIWSRFRLFCRRYSCRSAVWFLALSYSFWSLDSFWARGVLAFLAGEVLRAFLGFGSAALLDFVGLVKCLQSPGCSRMGADAGGRVDGS